MSNFKESQYGLLTCVARDMGITEFGLMVNQSWQQDSKGFLFTLARYKFVSKMFQGLERVLEIGCAGAYGTRSVQQTVRHGTATDFEPIFAENFKQRMNDEVLHTGFLPRPQYIFALCCDQK